MLSCIFGKCSSETYIVTNPKSPHSAIGTNGVAKINPLLSEFVNVTNTEVTVNHQNNEQQKNTVSKPVDHGRLEPNGHITGGDKSFSAQANHTQLEPIEQNTKVIKPVLTPTDAAWPESNDQNREISKPNKASTPEQHPKRDTHQESIHNIQPVLEEIHQNNNFSDKNIGTQNNNSVKQSPTNSPKENISSEFLAAEPISHHAPIANYTEFIEKQEEIKEQTDTIEVEVTGENIYEKNKTIPVKTKHQAPTPPRKKIVSNESIPESTTAEQEYVYKVNIETNGYSQESTDAVKEGAFYEIKESVAELKTKIEDISKELSDQVNAKPSGNIIGEALKSNTETKVSVTESADNMTETKEDSKKSVDTVQKEITKNTTDSVSKAKNNKKKDKKNSEQGENHLSKPSTIQEFSTIQERLEQDGGQTIRRRSGVIPLPIKYDENISASLPKYPKAPDDEDLIKTAIESNDFLNKIISGKRLEDVINSMYNKEIASKETIIKQGEKGSHMYVSAKGKYQVVVKGKVVSEFDDVRVFGELAILYNAKRLATIKALTPGRVWVLDRSVYQQIMLRYNIKEQDEIMEFLMNNKKLNVVGKDALQEVANLLKSEFFLPGKQIVRQGDKGHQFYIIRAGTVTITKDGEGVVGYLKKGDCFGELALLKEDCRQATVTANAPGVECLTLTRKEFIDHFGELENLTDIKVRPQDSIKDAIAEHEDINLNDLKIIKTLGVGGFGRVELVQHTKKKDLVFALKYLKKIDIVLQHQQEHVYNEKNIQMASKSPFIVRLYRTYKDSKYIYLLMESCLGGDLWSLLQKQKLRRFEEKEARFIAACVLEAFDYLHSRGIIYRDLKPENLLIASSGYIKLTDFGFAKKISSRGRTFTFAGTPEYVAPEIVLNRGHDRAVDYWAFGAFIFELLTGRTPFRTDDSSHMKTYNKILNGIDNIQFPSYVNLKARHIIEKLCRPVPSERLGMQRGGIKDIKSHKWFLGFEWQKFAKCEIPSPFKPKLKSQVDTQYFDQFKKDTDIPPDEISGWDVKF